MKITLLQRRGGVEEKPFCKELEASLASLRGSLKVEAKLQPFSKQGWAVVEIQGDDSEVFVELILREFGLVPSDLSGIERLGNYRGIVKSFDSDLIVDIGIQRPKATYARVKLSSVRAQLTDGRGSATAQEIAESYCLFPGTPISVRLASSGSDGAQIEGWLSDSQVDIFDEWINCGLERVQAYDCLQSELDFAIRKARLERDIVSTEQLNLTTHSVLCKIGTDAVGVMPKLGSILRRSMLQPFMPQRIRKRHRAWTDGIIQ